MGSHYGERNPGAGAISLDFHLIVADNGRGPNDWTRPSVRVTAGAPALKRNERAINLRMKLPLSLFEQPTIRATIDVADAGVQPQLDTRAIAEAVRGAIGMDIDLQVVAPDA